MTIHLGPLQAVPPDELQVMIDREMCARSFPEFVRRAWSVLEPPTQPLIWEWPLDAICEHLTAVTNGEIIRLLMNVPPGSMKSLLTGVFWPAWEWGPRGMPYQRIIGASYKKELAIRDSRKMRILLTSNWYQKRWGDKFALMDDQDAKVFFENDKRGFRAAFASTGITGARGDRLIFDDPHSVDGALSDAEREGVVTTFKEALQTRLNDIQKSAIIVIMQRLHERDVSGIILSEMREEYTHLMLPMRFEPERRCTTSIGFTDPRTVDGELLFPKRFPAVPLARLEKPMGVYGVAGQMQQRPEPRGGGILRRDAWARWTEEEAAKLGMEDAKKFPKFDYVVGSVDTAFTEKEENDDSAMTLWGVWRDHRNFPQVMMVYGWKDKLQFNELIEKIETTGRRYKIHALLIENKAAGISAAQEIRRRNADQPWQTILRDPGRIDKVARAYAVQGLLESGVVWAPTTRWADMVIGQCASFPRGAHDDVVDTVTQALSYLRETGFVRIEEEVQSEIEDLRLHKSRKVVPLYPA